MEKEAKKENEVNQIVYIDPGLNAGAHLHKYPPVCESLCLSNKINSLLLFNIGEEQRSRHSFSAADSNNVNKHRTTQK